MVTHVSSHGKNLYPLAEHMLSILDTPEPMVTLQREAARYATWTSVQMKKFEEIHGKDRADPRHRADSHWQEEDTEFVLLHFRQKILEITVEAIEAEAALVEELGGSLEDGAVKILDLLRRIFEQLDPLPCPENKMIAGDFSIRIPPPLQRLFIEKERSRRWGENHSREYLRFFYELQATLLDYIFERWVLELAPRGMVQFLEAKAYVVSKDWDLILLSPPR